MGPKLLFLFSISGENGKPISFSSLLLLPTCLRLGGPIRGPAVLFSFDRNPLELLPTFSLFFFQTKNSPFRLPNSQVFSALRPRTAALPIPPGARGARFMGQGTSRVVSVLFFLLHFFLIESGTRGKEGVVQQLLLGQYSLGWLVSRPRPSPH